jgi:Domain of unknown function (DUF6894)
MARYFFHQHEHGFDALDEEGALFADDDAAIAGATNAARELAAGAVQEGRLIDGEHLEVVDQIGRLVSTLYWRDVIRLRGRDGAGKLKS